MNFFKVIVPLQLFDLARPSVALAIGSLLPLESWRLTSTCSLGRLELLGSPERLSVMTSSGKSKSRYHRVIRTKNTPDTRWATTRSKSSPNSSSSVVESHSGDSGDTGVCHDSLRDMTVAQLKQRLKSLGRKVSGSKRELMDRLSDGQKGDGWFQLQPWERIMLDT